MKSIGSNSQQWLLLSSLILTFLVQEVWNGFACLSNPCVHGVCLDDINSTYFCYCIDGYTGIQCQTNWNECWSSPCHNGGVCIDGIAMFNCSCPAGYAGDLCEEDINECESNPCLNNGTCLDAQNGYTCNCMPGYSGEHCEIDVAVCNATNETRCLNGGICEEGPGESFTCYCQPGWGGFLCSSEIDECMSAPCQNGGVCIDLLADYSCACLFGFTGKNCEEAIQICDNSPCKNGALCLMEENHPVCYCVPDFHGDLCQFQYDECQLGPRCMNGGTCIDGIDNFTCSCPPNLTGVLCECLILGDNKLDCTYVSPTSIDISTTTSSDITTIRTNISTAVTTTVASPVSFETTQVPTTTVLTPTDVTEFFNETVATTLTSTSTDVTVPSTTFFTTELSTTFYTTTVTLELNITSSEILSHTTLPSVTTTELITTTEQPTSSTMTIYPLETTESTITTTTFEETTEHPLTSTETTSTTELIPDTELTTPFQNQTISTTEITTPSIEFTSPPNVSILPPTVLTETTIVGDTTTFVTVTEGRETNRTFPDEETTHFPSITTLLSTELSKEGSAHTSTYTSTAFITFEPTTSLATEQTTTLITADCTKFDSRCQNGGTCVFIDQGHKCICPFDTEGQLCESKLGVRNAAFNGESYLSHRLLNFSHILIEFEAKTMSDSGLLFYANVDTTYMALYVQEGFLKFKFSCGYQTMLLSELKVPVNNGYAMKIRAELEFSNDFKHCDATIKVNNSLSMTGDQTAKVDQFLKPSAWLHMGGVPHEFSTEILPVNGFIGCMTNLKISNKSINIYKDAEDGMEVTECSSLACLSSPCHNGASCTTVNDSWQCHCKNGYLGKTCDISICDNNPCLFGGTCIPFTNMGYVCLCPYGKHGHFCENDLKITEPYFSSTVRGLSSYVAYPIPDGISKNMELKFRFTPTSMEQISLLLFVGQSG